MSLKASKSKILVLTNGRVDYDAKIYINTNQFRELNQNICSNPVKFLGRAISFDLTDKDQIEINNSAIWTWLSLIDKPKHREVHKIWILQNLLVPRLWWPLLIYEIPISTVLRFEQKISSYLRKWLCIHRSTSHICLYSSISRCQLPIKKLS